MSIKSVSKLDLHESSDGNQSLKSLLGMGWAVIIDVAQLSLIFKLSD